MVDSPENRQRKFTTLEKALAFVEMARPTTIVIQQQGDAWYVEYSGTEGQGADEVRSVFTDASYTE